MISFRLKTVALVAAGICLSVNSSPADAQRPQGRVLAPGVMKLIPARPAEEETFSGPREVVELQSALKQWQPNLYPPSSTLYELTRQAIFRRPVHQLEFSFKPVRIIDVELPGPDGQLQRKLIWYLIYRVKNTGAILKPVARQDESGNSIYEVQRVNQSIRFFPLFVLEGLDQKQKYVDQVIPVAVAAIHKREIRDLQVKLHNSVEITTIAQQVSTDEVDHSIWGVATWENVDPRTDFFSVYVQGLSSAFRWEDPEGAFKAGDPPGTGRELTYKTLQLNFWRPGDTIREQEDVIRYGMPDNARGAEAERVLKLYDVPETMDHRWVYRP